MKVRLGACMSLRCLTSQWLRQLARGPASIGAEIADEQLIRTAAVSGPTLPHHIEAALQYMQVTVTESRSFDLQEDFIRLRLGFLDTRLLQGVVANGILPSIVHVAFCDDQVVESAAFNGR